MSVSVIEPFLIWLAIPAFVACGILALLPSKGRNGRKQNDIRRSLMSTTRLHTSNTFDQVHLVPQDEPETPDYGDMFPPSTRETLNEIIPQFPPGQRKALEARTFEDQTFRRSQLGFHDNYETGPATKYSCTGLSVGEIRALGKFPDYAALSGVPLPQPYQDFNIETALPRPYRPFRWTYHQTMSLSKMEPDFWIELESTYKKRIAERQSLFAQYGGDVLQDLPGSELACRELMEMAVQFICARYPHYFHLSEDRSVLINKILNATTNLITTPPLITLLDNVPEDFAIMLRNPKNGCYYCQAGIICSAIGWNLGLKMGRSLPEIHLGVPDYKEKMQFSMDRFFTKIPASKPIQRGSWFFEIEQPLYMPPNDPREQRMKVQDAHLDPKDIHLRVDWQTLRRLPLSGAVVFNFKALFTPITELCDEAYIPSLILKLLSESKENILKYKHTWHIEHIVKPLMAQYEREQIENGLVPKDWLRLAPQYPGRGAFLPELGRKMA